MSSDRWDHVGLNVRDLARCERWYCEAFELRREFAYDLEEFEFSFVMLVARDGFRLELLARAGSSPGPRFETPLQAVLTEGFGHVALQVADVDEVYERLLGLGATSRLAPVEAPVPDTRMAFVADPEGNLLELLSRADAADGGALSMSGGRT